KDYRRRQDHSKVYAHREDQIQIASGMRVNQLRIQMRVRKRFQHGPIDPGHDVFREIHADERANADSIERIDDALAQLAKVLEKRHRAARLLGAARVLRVESGVSHGYHVECGASWGESCTFASAASGSAPAAS